MEPREFLDILHVAERLKDTPRHCTTSRGRRESVAEHSWRVALMALLLRDVFPGLDAEKLMAMCLIHDLGECFTGDIPVFRKTDEDRKREEELLCDWVDSLSEPTRGTLASLYREMDAQETTEAKLYKALDKLEAVIQHNESPLSTWEEHEFELPIIPDGYEWRVCMRSDIGSDSKNAVLTDRKIVLGARSTVVILGK